MPPVHGGKRCLRFTLWICLLTCSLPLRLMEAISLGLFVKHIEKMATHHGPKLLAGAFTGFIFSCIFLLLHSLVDRALLCSAYVAIYCYACGASIAAIARALRCIHVSRTESVRWVHETCTIGRWATLDDPHYTGLLVGLLFCFSTITVRQGRADPTATFLTWCQPHPAISPFAWGVGWAFLGVLATQLSFMTQTEYAELESDSRHKNDLLRVQTAYNESFSGDEDEMTDTDTQRTQ